MTTNPQTLQDLGSYWVAQGGTNLGVVGNAAHTSGYHCGRDRIYGGSGQGDADYSVRLARDKAGLTNAASAIDLGKLAGSLVNLRAFSRDLVKRCMAQPITRHDVREIIYSPDGVKVQRWSGVDNAIHTGPGNGDSSHLTHTHISFYRDSETRDKRPLFAPYFATDVSTGDDMTVHLKAEDWTPTLRTDAYLTNGVFRASPERGGVVIDRAAPNEVVRSIAEVRTSAATNNDWRLTRRKGVDAYMLYSGKTDWVPVKYGGDPAVDALLTDLVDRKASVDTISQAQYDTDTKALKGELAKALGDTKALKTDLAKARDDTQAAIEASAGAARIERERIAAAEAARIRSI